MPRRLFIVLAVQLRPPGYPRSLYIASASGGKRLSRWLDCSFFLFYETQCFLDHNLEQSITERRLCLYQRCLPIVGIPIPTWLHCFFSMVQIAKQSLRLVVAVEIIWCFLPESCCIFFTWNDNRFNSVKKGILCLTANFTNFKWWSGGVEIIIRSGVFVIDSSKLLVVTIWYFLSDSVNRSFLVSKPTMSLNPRCCKFRILLFPIEPSPTIKIFNH